MPTTYAPSRLDSWLLFATTDSVLYYEATVSISTDDLWVALNSDSGVQAVLDILTRGGLSSTPSFALARFGEGDVHALVRGPILLDVEAAGGNQSIDGTGVSTWRETTVSAATGIATSMNSSSLPLGSGVVHAAGFAFTLLATDSGAAPAPARIVAVPPVAPIADAPIAAAPVADAPIAAAPREQPVAEQTIMERIDDDVLHGELATPAPAAPVAAADSNGFAHLFEETVHRSIEDAAIRSAESDDDAEPAPSTPTEAEPQLGDHDGETVMSADIAALRARKKQTQPTAKAATARTIVLELPGDVRETLVQPIIVGRSPSASQVAGSELPRLVTIPGNQDISRSHARFALEGDTVVVTDLHSRNGTIITLPGKSPQTLRKGEPTAVLPDTVVDLGGGVTLVVRES